MAADAPAPAPSTSTEPRWGRVLICGGTDWPRLGRKKDAKTDADDLPPDLLEPHLLRSLAAIRATSVHSSCSSTHFVVLADTGAAHIFGRNTFGSLGIPTKGAGGAEQVPEAAPRVVRAPELPGGGRESTIVHAALGRAHTVLVGSDGQVWSAGKNDVGQCGHPPCSEVSSFKLVKGPWTDAGERPIRATAGLTFTLVLTDAGRLFAFGSGEHGQLGNGRTGEHIVSAGKTGFDVKDEPVPVKGLDGKRIVEVAAGQQHALALDADGVVYVWGYGGYGRLGLGSGSTRDLLLPEVHPHFAGPNPLTMGAHVYGGPACSVVVDKQGMFWLAGKWKNTGDGSSGQPWSSFRYHPDIQTCKMTHASLGGVTLFALAAEEGGVMTVAWGQNASNGELGLGEDKPKSATSPQQNMPLAGLDVIDVAAGQNTTLFLVRPSTDDKYVDLPRHPEAEDAPELCAECDGDDAEDNPLLACDKCDYPYHPSCVGLGGVPDGEWFCPVCVDAPEAPLGAPRPKRKGAGGAARKRGREDEGAAEDGAGKGKGAGAKRKK